MAKFDEIRPNTVRRAANSLKMQGFSPPQIATRFGVSDRTINRWTAEPPPPPPRTPDTSWMASGLCSQTDPELFFGEAPGNFSIEAKSICRRCEVQEQCLEWALETRQEDGIWGGKGPKQRRRIRRERRTQ